HAADLSRATVTQATLVGANLTSATLKRSNLMQASLGSANFSGADLSGANLISAQLDTTDFRGATLTGAWLIGAALLKTDLRTADLTGANIFGISAWGVELAGATQRDLVITLPDDPVITVDNLEVAQFIYLLMNSNKIRDVIDTVTSKVVLILGRFTPE